MANDQIPRKEDEYPDPNYPQSPRFIPVISTIVILVSIVVMWWMFNFHFQDEIGPEQPVPFSHRTHAGMKKIGCVMCHEGVFTSANAGIPPVQTCILCHEKIIITYPPIEKLRGMYIKNQPIEWVKTGDLPDYVYFNHSMHLSKNIDCSRCHGDVLQMDRIERVEDFTMGFCIQCHRDNNATIDCFTCHR